MLDGLNLWIPRMENVHTVKIHLVRWVYCAQTHGVIIGVYIVLKRSHVYKVSRHVPDATIWFARPTYAQTYLGVII